MWLEIGAKRVFTATGGRDFDPGLPAVVLVHGAGGDHSVWDVQSRGLAEGGRAVLAPDLPGHGYSDGPALTSITALADWLTRLLDAAGLGRAALIGHSMGALAALDAAARHPERVRAVALLGAAAAMPVHGDLLTAARDDVPTAAAMITAWGYCADHPPAPEIVRRDRSLLESSAPGVLHADLAACDGYRDGQSAAAELRCPATVIVGGNDRMSHPKAGSALAEAIAASRTIVLADTGHMMMAERPQAVLDALLTAV